MVDETEDMGVARTKHLAKIGSQVAKPDGLCFIDPATELAPYDCRLGALSALERKVWNAKTRRQISNRWQGRATRFVVLAGADYAGAVEDLPAVFPLAGLQVGERLREMNRLLASGGLNNSEAI